MWRQDIFIPQSAGSFRMPVVLLRIGLNDRIDTLAMEQNEWFSVPLGRGGTSFETPLARPVFAAAAGKTAWLCLAREGKCSVHDLESGTRDTISIGIPQRPLSASAWASALRDSSERPPIRSRDPERSTSAILEMLPRPETFPRFARMQADATDRLWVQTYEHHDVSAATWLVVTRQGSAVARVQLPAGLKPLEIGRGFLLGLTVDSDGVERVSSYTFKPIP